MRILYCNQILNPKQVDEDYNIEEKAALKYGFTSLVFSYEELIKGNTTKALKQLPHFTEKQACIYRGWMLTPEQYKNLYDALISRNIELINTPEEYKQVHYLPESYACLESKTPKTVWTTHWTEDSLMDLLKPFGENPIVVKDFVKSEKHHWEEACFIPNASDKQKVNSVVNRFIELRGEYINQGLVFRQFESLEFLTNHSKSRMPLTKEFRVFFIQGEVLKVYPYWEEGEYDTISPPLQEFVNLAQKINTPFFTMDIAQKTDGEWIVMEVGEAQVSGLPKEADSDSFYKALSTYIGR